MLRALTFSALLAVSAHAGVDVERLVDALRARESGNQEQVRDGDGGRSLGPWQIGRAVWSLHMPGKPHAGARNPLQARECARRHVQWLMAQLKARGVNPCAFNIALAWNAGLAGSTRGRAPLRAYEYARDVEAIYLGAKGQKTVKSPASQWSLSQVIRWVG